jgi:hypothetical protein
VDRHFRDNRVQRHGFSILTIGVLALVMLGIIFRHRRAKCYPLHTHFIFLGRQGKPPGP